MKAKLAALIGPAAGLVVFGLGLVLGWGFAVTLIGSMCALLGGNLAGLALRLRKKKEDE
jgi:hypothetical protein